MRFANVPEQLRSGPFTVEAAARHGVTKSALRGREWRQVFRGIWVHSSLDDTLELRVAAAKLVVPAGGVLCGLTAAWVYGADVRREDDLDVHVCFPEGRRIRSRPGLVVTQASLTAGDVVAHDGLLITTAARTAFDCLRLLKGVERLVVADALTHLRRTTVEEVRRGFDRSHRARNQRVGAALLEAIEPLSESPMETRLRVRLTDGGLPRPQAQWEVRDAAGQFVARLDLAYPEERVAVEYDGAWHWTQRRDDDRRRDAVRRLGWIVIVVSADDVYRRSEQVCAEVAHALRARRRSTTPSTVTFEAS